MTSVSTVPDVVAWDNPPHLSPRGTVVLLPGRGEDPLLYERFGARLAADAYRVRAVADPTRWEEDSARQLKRLRADEELPRPFVLAGSDAGALFAVGLAARGQVDVDALLLACTEIPVALAGLTFGVPILDATDMLARECVAWWQRALAHSLSITPAHE